MMSSSLVRFVDGFHCTVDTLQHNCDRNLCSPRHLRRVCEVVASARTSRPRKMSAEQVQRNTRLAIDHTPG